MDATMMPGVMQLVREQRPGFVATVDADGTANLSPCFSPTGSVLYVQPASYGRHLALTLAMVG